MTFHTITRRSAVLSLSAVAMAPARAAVPAPRVAALDWTLATACLSLGLAEMRLFERWVGEPALPPGIVELRLREAPSLEGLAQLASDLILVDADLARAEAALGDGSRPAVLPFDLTDDRHLRIYADVLRHLGVVPAWTGATSPWCTATTDFAALAGVAEATLVLIDPVPAESEHVLVGGVLWAGLTAGRRVLHLPAAWPFAGLLAAALTRGDGGCGLTP